MELILHGLLVLLLLECGTAWPTSGLQTSARARREAGPVIISFTVDLYNGTRCNGGDTAGLCDTNLTLQYRNESSEWREIATRISIGSSHSFDIVNTSGCGCVEVRLVQKEHGGGNCSCWRLTNLTLNEESIS